MAEIRVKAEILSTKRKCTSVNGNPSWWVTFKNMETGKVLMGYTANDYSCGYSINNWKCPMLEYHITRNGNVVITRCEKD